MKTINNLDIILDFLNFESPDDFYFLQVIRRKKENPDLGAYSKVVKSYQIKSKEHLLSKYDEIKNLCNLFNARALIRLNKRSFKKVAFLNLEMISKLIVNEQYESVGKLYAKSCGGQHNKKGMVYLLDVDFEHLQHKQSLLEILNKVRPLDIDKLVFEIPTKTGVHLITKPFDLELFNKLVFQNLNIKIDVHKDSPTNLYIP